MYRFCGPLFLALVAMCGSAQSQDAAGDLGKARASYWAGQFEAALPWYARYAATHPNDHVAVVEYGYCLLRTGRKSDAWEVLRSAARSGVAGVAAESTWVDLSIQLGRPKSAVPVADRLRRRYPNDRDIARLRARLLEATGDAAGAARAWQDLLRQWPDDSDALLSLGRQLSWAGDSDGAVEAFRMCVREDPKDTRARSLLAQEHGWRWDWEEAGRVVDEGLKLTPGNSELEALAELEREYFAPRISTRGFWWDDSDDYLRSGASAEASAVFAHRVLLRATGEWARFEQRERGFPVVRRVGTTVAAAWLGPEELKVEGSYTRFDSSEVGRSSAFSFSARRRVLEGVVGAVSAGRDDVTEKYFALLEKVNVRHAAISAWADDPNPLWSARLGFSHFSDDADRVSLDTRLATPVVGPLSGEWHNWSFWQDRRSYLYFGPKWYTEQEFSVVCRPFRDLTSLSLEARAGVQLALGDNHYELSDTGDIGAIGELKLEYRLTGSVRVGARAKYDSLNTGNPYSGYGGEAWLEFLF